MGKNTSVWHDMPRWLKQPLADDDKEHIKTAVIKHLYEHGIQPADAPKMTFQPKMFYEYFKEHDHRYTDLPKSRMTTYAPFFQSMYTYVNRYKLKVPEIEARVEQLIERLEASNSKISDRLPDKTVSEQSSVISAHEEKSNEAQKSSTIAHDEELAASMIDSCSKEKTKPISLPMPIPPPIDIPVAQPQLGQKRTEPLSDLSRYGADTALLFEARETMKRAKIEHEEARRTI